MGVPSVTSPSKTGLGGGSRISEQIERCEPEEEGARRGEGEQFTDLEGAARAGEVFSVQTLGPGGRRVFGGAVGWEGGKKRRENVIKFLEILGDPGEQ